MALIDNNGYNGPFDISIGFPFLTRSETKVYVSRILNIIASSLHTAGASLMTLSVIASAMNKLLAHCPGQPQRVRDD